MIRRLKLYPAYKDSGMPWLGKVPEHWEIKRGKHLFRSIDVRSATGKEELLTVSSKRGVVPRHTVNVTMFKAESYFGYKLCWPSDLVINSLWAWARGLGVSRYHGIVSSAYGVYRLRPKFEDYSQFIHELVRSTPFQWELQVRSKGIWVSRLQLTDEAFLGAPFPVPSQSDQFAIGRFLDWVDRRIRRVIRANQKRIKLLAEYKHALIHGAVTGQIDVRTGQPYSAYKPSGFKWLGDVPEHWNVMQLSRCLRKIDQGWSPIADEGTLTENQWAVLTLSSVKRGRFDPRAVKPVPITAKVPLGIEVADGDLLLTRSNTRELVGDVCIVNDARPKTVLCDLIYRLSLEESFVDGGFLMYQLLSRVGRDQIERDARGSSGTMPKIAQRHIRSWHVAIPPLAEQRFIFSYIDQVVSQFDKIRDLSQCAIELLQEFHERLTADVVTGKLDVREVAALLPEEPEAEMPEPLDVEETVEVNESLAEEDLETFSEGPVS